MSMTLSQNDSTLDSAASSPQNFMDLITMWVSPVELVLACGLTLLILAVMIWGLITLMQVMQAVPEKHRRMAPGLVWLAIIPCFNLIWNWFLVIWITKSLEDAFAEAGISDARTGRGKGFTYATLAVIRHLVVLALSTAMGLMSAMMTSGVEDPGQLTAPVWLPSILDSVLAFVTFLFFILFVLEVKSASRRLNSLGGLAG